MERAVSKRVFIKTYGCQMNVYDSSRMAELLTPLGYEMTEEPEGADLAILNTCHIREKAAEKVFSELGQIRLLKNAKAKGGGHMLIAVGGCLAQAEGAELLRRAPFVDIVFGPQTYHRLPEFVARAARASGRGILETSFPPESKFDYLPQAGAAPGVSAFLSVQEGCDKFCTFCVVPYTRGAEYSRPAAQILAEARRLVAFGAREITLLGQNVSAYHGAGPNGGKWGLGDLLRALSVVPGLERLRYTTSHPRDVEESLIAAHRELPKLMPFLHLPVQSGSDRVLTLMNRRHTADDYRRIVERLRRARPDLALSSDFIVGFAGESEEDFAATLALVREIGFAQGFSFKYSPRPGTPAAAASGQVPEPQKAERLTLLQGLLREQQRRFNDGFLGRVQPVLLERRGRHPGQLAGKSPHHQSVHVMAGKERLGEIVPVLVRQSGGGSLGGTLAEALSQ
jgi:tRNA-2-methylthio-N6-dimethylallyladenosine synthase